VGEAALLILRVGEVDEASLRLLEVELGKVLPVISRLSSTVIPIPRETYNPGRHQFHSTVILQKASENLAGFKHDRFLLVTEEDLYVPGLNFVFGEAYCPGRYAVISLRRLRPEFYRGNLDLGLFHERALKEAVHELGHTFGLKHCPNPRCVMHFSNSILDVDLKQSKLCERCTGLPKL